MTIPFKKLIIIILGLTSALPTMGQVVEFSADTSRLFQRTGRRTEVLARAMEMSWMIEGQELCFGSPPIKLKVDADKMDTLYYKQRFKADWDTILFNAYTAGSYLFVHNDCCGIFDLFDADSQRRIPATVVFELAAPPETRLLGMLGEAGVLLNKTDTLTPVCHSAMASNIIPLGLMEIDSCVIDSTCQGLCLVQSGASDSYEHFSYKLISKKLDVLFMPLTSEGLRVIYDPRSDQLRLK